MKLDLRSRGVPLTHRLTEHVQRRLSFALSRFGARVERVRVRFVDVNGPRGGEDIRCQMEVRLVNGGDLVVRETRSDPFAAVARASERVGRGVARRLDRFRARRRRRR